MVASPAVTQGRRDEGYGGWSRTLRLALAVAAWVAACAGEPEGPLPEEIGRCADVDPLRQVYFGDLHAHSTLSLDANVQGTLLSPADVYRFARGEEVGLQPHTATGEPLRRVRLARPLDFVALTDHAEFQGMLAVCSTPGLPGYDHPQCDDYRDNPDLTFFLLNALMAPPPEEIAWPALCGDGGEACMDQGRLVWQDAVDAAEAAYDRTPACALTTFLGYEWSPSPGTRNLHRNVIFRSSEAQELPTTCFEAPTVEGLWADLRRDCLDAGSGCDALTIPHNSNLSSGIMFEEVDDEGQPFSAAYVAERALMEPLAEVFQHKGSSECEPVTGDELCGFEHVPYATLSGSVLGMRAEAPPQDFLRNALGRGLSLREALGANPFRYGFLGSTDTHLGTPGLVDESASFPGHGGAGPGAREALPPGLTDVVEFNPGGLAAIWAEENSREALFQALRRREVYATSGPRLTLRVFGGWSLGPDLCAAPDLAARGYAAGVPMGGTLPTRPEGATAPTFVVRAEADPGVEGAPGAMLARLQIIEGWLEGGEPRFAVHDLATTGSASVDPETCELEGEEGEAELCAVWTDPDFDPAAGAVYYARVLEDPTCRWATRACLAAGVDCDAPATVTEGFEGCCLDTWERVIQERAWSSPIWYEPE